MVLYFEDMGYRVLVKVGFIKMEVRKGFGVLDVCLRRNVNEF